jgi:hypothetical protein
MGEICGLDESRTDHIIKAIGVITNVIVPDVDLLPRNTSWRRPAETRETEQQLPGEGGASHLRGVDSWALFTAYSAAFLIRDGRQRYP